MMDSQPIQLPCVLFSTLIMIIPFPFKWNESRMCCEQWLLFNRCCSWNHIKSIQRHSDEWFFGSFTIVALLFIRSTQHIIFFIVTTLPHGGYCHDNFHVFISFAHFSMQSHRVIIIIIENGISSAHTHHDAKQWHGYWHKWMHSAFISMTFFKSGVCLLVFSSMIHNQTYGFMAKFAKESFTVHPLKSAVIVNVASGKNVVLLLVGCTAFDWY